MNYLLHIYFCPPEPEPLLGACLGDFFKGAVDALPYSAGLRQGIALHRRLDGFADTHPVILQSKRLFPPNTRRMAGIALDIFYDHFLAAQWAQFSPLPLETYTQRFYALAKKHSNQLPTEAKSFLEMIYRSDWLTGYRHQAVIAQVLARMSRHIPFANTLDQTAQVLQTHYAALNTSFHQFMQDARTSFPYNNGDIAVF